MFGGGSGWGLQSQCGNIVSNSGFGGSGAGASMQYATVGFLACSSRPFRRTSSDETVTLCSGILPFFAWPNES